LLTSWVLQTNDGEAPGVLNGRCYIVHNMGRPRVVGDLLTSWA
jgi:hypothetical protein